MTSEYVIEVSESEFQHEVLAYSNQVPVVVDFWAEWCIPCRTLGPILEKLAEEGEGAFRLAKVNVDENKGLAQHYQIASIPAVKVFQSGEIVDEFLGVRPEPEVRQFLRSLTPSASDLSVEKGQSLYLDHQPEEAAEAFRQALISNPDHSEALLGLAKSELSQGNSTAALVVLREFPASKQYSAAERLTSIAAAMANLALDEKEISDGKPNDAAYLHSLNLVGKGNLPAALDGLLEIMQADKEYQDGKIRKIILGALEMLDQESEQTREFRAEFSSLLF